MSLPGHAVCSTEQPYSKDSSPVGGLGLWRRPGGAGGCAGLAVCLASRLASCSTVAVVFAATRQHAANLFPCDCQVVMRNFHVLLQEQTLHYGVCVCVCVCVLGEGGGGGVLFAMSMSARTLAHSTLRTSLSQQSIAIDNAQRMKERCQSGPVQLIGVQVQLSGPAGHWHFLLLQYLLQSSALHARREAGDRVKEHRTRTLKVLAIPMEETILNVPQAAHARCCHLY